MEIRLVPWPRCLVCGAEGEKLYRGVPDRLWGAPGTYDLSRCPRCALLWIDPRPAREDLHLCYGQGYFTHDDRGGAAESPRRLAALRDALRFGILCGRYGYTHLPHRHLLCAAGPALSLIPALDRRATFDLGPRLPRFSDGLLVDVGCGRGTYLRKMADLGWRVLGVEPDPAAAKLARSKGLEVVDGFLENAKLADASVQHLSMSHVIEHLWDPRETLKECRRVLRPGGRLVLHTPNAASLGHRTFGSFWYPLDPPRHLFVFSPENLSRLLGEFFREVRVETILDGEEETFDECSLIAEKGRIQGLEIPPRAGRAAFARKAALGRLAGKPWGEDLVAVAVK